MEHEDNLIVRAARLLMKTAADSGRLPTGSGANISIDKRLPMGGGLGGGSSNAATVLVALNHLWQCGLSMDELAEMGLTLGADVPVFVRGHAAFAEGVGEILTPVDPPEKWYLVAHPGVSIPTPVIFKDPELPRNTPKRSIETLLKCEFTQAYGRANTKGAPFRRTAVKCRSLGKLLLECAGKCLLRVEAVLQRDVQNRTRSQA
nr:unnamed protein product [Escherichia coli]